MQPLAGADSYRILAIEFTLLVFRRLAEMRLLVKEKDLRTTLSLEYRYLEAIVRDIPVELAEARNPAEAQMWISGFTQADVLLLAALDPDVRAELRGRSDRVAAAPSTHRPIHVTTELFANEAVQHAAAHLASLPARAATTARQTLTAMAQLELERHESTVRLRYAVSGSKGSHSGAVSVPDRVVDILRSLPNDSAKLFSTRVGETLAWRRELADLLFPILLPAVVSNSDQLVLMLSGDLWSVPFAGLEADGKFLAECAVISYLPSAFWLPLTTASDWNVGSRGVAFYDESVSDADDELAALKRLDPDADVLNTRRSLLNKLGNAASSGHEFDVLMLSGHGHGSGDSFGVGPESLSIADVLSVPLPRTVLAASCRSHETIGNLAVENVSFSTACLASGARATVGAIANVPGRETSWIIARLIDGIRMGEAPSAALRNGQLAFLEETNRRMPLITWAALTCFGGIHSRLASPSPSP